MVSLSVTTRYTVNTGKGYERIEGVWVGGRWRRVLPEVEKDRGGGVGGDGGSKKKEQKKKQKKKKRETIILSLITLR